MQGTKLQEISKEQGPQDQLQIQKAALLSWFAQLRSQPQFFVPIHGNSGVGSGPSVLYRETAQKMIKKYSLKPLDEMIQTFLTPDSKLPEPIGMLLRWGPSNGGWPGPHFHCDNQVYILSESQWQEFSQEAVRVLADKLTRAEKISPGAFAEVTNAVSSVAG